MITTFKKNIKTHLKNIPGWRTNRKIVVIESDDWGSIRTPSESTLKSLKATGLKTEKCHYIQNDSLASEEDLNQLFELLTTIKTYRGHNPVITANTIVANPDFEKIKLSEFSEYHFEPFYDTLKKYPNHNNSFKLWIKAQEEGIFRPQFHGREHLQVKRWLKYLQNNHYETIKAFERSVFGISTTMTSENRKSFLAAYDWDNHQDREFILDSITNGLNMFKIIFNYPSLSSIAPNYVWDNKVEKKLKNEGVKFIQGSSVQRSPGLNQKSTKKIRHYTGQQNDFNQLYTVRNCLFEPSSDPSADWVSRCLNDINAAFFWKKPAIIETHRVNFIGFINPLNRNRNLKLFKTLLEEIIRKWPDVEFMSSDQLGLYIRNNE